MKVINIKAFIACVTYIIDEETNEEFDYYSEYEDHVIQLGRRFKWDAESVAHYIIHN